MLLRQAGKHTGKQRLLSVHERLHEACIPLKAEDALFVKHVTAAQQYLFLQAKVLATYTALVLRILALSRSGMHAGPFLLTQDCWRCLH